MSPLLLFYLSKSYMSFVSLINKKIKWLYSRHEWSFVRFSVTKSCMIPSYLYCFCMPQLLATRVSFFQVYIQRGCFFDINCSRRVLLNHRRYDSDSFTGLLFNFIKAFKSLSNNQWRYQILIKQKVRFPNDIYEQL